MRDELLSSINVTSSQDERDFYARFVALKLEGLTEGAPLRTEVVNRLQELVAGDDGQDVLLFDRLCRIARDGAGTAQKWTRGADRQREWRDRNPSNTQIERQRSARRCRQPLLIVGYQLGDRGRSPPGHDKRSRRAGSAFSAANRA